MSNTLTGGKETLMSQSVQRYLANLEIFRKLASFQEEAVLVKGTTVNRPFRTGFIHESYTANTDITASDTALTAATLVVNNSDAVRIDIDPVEDIQLLTNPDSLRALYGPRMAYILAQLHDRDFFDEVDNAALGIDESDFLSGSSTDDPIDLRTVPAEDVWTKAFSELDDNGIGAGGLYAVIDPGMVSEITQRGMATGFNIADSFFKNGFKGDFAGFDIFVSSNLPSSQAFTLSDATAANTFTLRGITWTAVDTLGSTAGTVYTNTATLDDWGTNLAKAISGDTAATFYVEVSGDKRDNLRTRGLTASYDTGTNVLTVTGYGRFKVKFTDGTAVAGEQTIKAMCGQFGAIDMVVQMQPHMQFNKQPANLGSSLLAHTLWGTKTFQDGAQRLLKLLIKG